MITLVVKIEPRLRIVYCPRTTISKCARAIKATNNDNPMQIPNCKDIGIIFRKLSAIRLSVHIVISTPTKNTIVFPTAGGK